MSKSLNADFSYSASQFARILFPNFSGIGENNIDGKKDFSEN